MTAAAAGGREQVVLLDESGAAIGAADKAEVHHSDTPLHLAFSCYLFDDHGRLLLTRRALDKRTFPGLWTNSCCGHPAPGEPMGEAVSRRVAQELGVVPEQLTLVLPAFRYRAVMDDGTVENEMCPVWTARCSDPDAVAPDPTEVADHEWVDWAGFRADVLEGRRDVSQWCREQLLALPEDPLAAPASYDGLPPAAAGEVG
ncbi:isopentenyl-diphosphate Delta-isomerase [Nocardioides sp. TF02-7]|uniref:isopentenyl-diphosphate Delta-isomerase n=1 Tax=Nocardioides sp. TF02-7 TaxID=2917724 RepID=UPI001F0705EB|nr:isopentenyl-diphosphate Delta-isomerase [Nocardioides sp. TF02-7]UMG94461.1 isopentenyl-diphosphate Delta-isomerase [Nocardioides sp. TF02-7]